MPEMHLKQPGFTYNACDHFTKNKKRTEKFIQTGNIDVFYRNELDKTCFQYDMAYGKSNDLAKSEKVLRDEAFKIFSDPKYDGYQRGLASMVYRFFDKKSSASGVDTESNYKLANELQSRLLENSRKEKFIHLLQTIFGALI